MKALFDGKEIDIELSPKAEKELSDLRKKLNLDSISDNIICSEPRWRFLLYEVGSGINSQLHEGFLKQAIQDVNKIVSELEEAKVEIMNLKYELKQANIKNEGKKK